MPPGTSAGFWVISPFTRQSNLTPLFPLTLFLFVHLFSSSCGISPLRSSFLFRSSFLLSVHNSFYVHHSSSSFIISITFPLRSSVFFFGQVPPITSPGFWVTSPFARQSNLTPLFPLTFFLFVHYFSSSFIISPLRSSFLLFVHHFSSAFIISPLPSSFLLFLHHFSSSFIIAPLRSSCLLFVHHLSSSFIFALIHFPLRSSAAGHVGRALDDFSFCTSIKFDTAVSVYIFPLRSIFLLFVHDFSSRSLFLLFVHHVSSSFIMSPLCSTFFLFVHHFSSSFIISPLRSSFLLFVHHFSSSFITSPLRSSFLFFVHHFSSAFIMSPFRLAFLLFVHHFPSSFIFFP